MNKKLLTCICFIAALITINLILWGIYLGVARYDPNQPDIPAVIGSYFMDADKLAALWNDLLFGRGLQGSAIYVRYSLALFLLPVIYAVQRYLPIPSRWAPFHTNWVMVTIMAAWTFVGMTINGIAQAEDWYFQNIICGACGATIRFPGTFDFATHFNIIAIFSGWAIQFDIMKFFGLVGRIGQLIKNAIISLIIIGIAIWWEIVESINPDRYWNLFGNSLSDIAASMVAILVVILITYWIIYDRVIYVDIRQWTLKFWNWLRRSKW